MRIVEIFASKQGEGLWTGEPSAFVRVGGCRLHCRYCDTPYASWNCEEGENLTADQVVQRVISLKQPHVVVTGGEPMLFRETTELTQKLERLGLIITIETSGTIDLPVRSHLTSISPKLSNSTPDISVGEKILCRHEQNRQRISITQKLIDSYSYQLKFVADAENDLPEIEFFLQQLSHVNKNRVFLMPQAITAEEISAKEKWLRPYAEEKKYVYCPRMQILWYGNRRGT
ncbi:MAG: 7-carboxy-7-deazaguanine synthase QueE [Planctomycetaceae bacterium]|jgi:7-carboxy-7-deazaguanine synthase|nr:7-carboxy-7-deazaguanine synthase QueE [Planctomycetaceae bacterium]